MLNARAVDGGLLNREAAGGWPAIPPGGSVGAPSRPLDDLGGEEIESDGAGRLVGPDVLAIDFAALDEELAAGAEGRAPAEGDRHLLGDDLALERFRG